MEWVIVGLVLYFIPSVVAFHWMHPQRVAIFFLNLLAGWTFIGWVVAIVWALARPAAPLASPQAATASDEISRLADLRERGHLSDDEFAAQKAKALSR